MSIGYRAPLDGEDWKFVISNWLDSWRTSYTAGLIEMDDWYPTMWPKLERMLARPTVRTILAYEKKEKSRIADLYGFITADTTTHIEPLERGSFREWPALVYYVYVKAPYRKKKHARALFKAIGIDPEKPFAYVCKTAVVSQLERKVPQAAFRPLLARFPKADRRNET